MSLPKGRPDPYACQLRSPLFRLPRELRDDIYRYYVSEEDGYFHNIDTGKISLAGRKPIDLCLMYTCRAIGAEMKGVAIPSNKVTFTTGDIEDSIGFHGLRSRAGRFKQALDIVIRQRFFILFQVLPLITPEVLEQVIAKFGFDGRYLAGILANLRIQWGIPERLQPTICLYSRDNPVNRHEVPVNLDRALRYTLQLASGHPNFEQRALIAFDSISGAGSRAYQAMSVKPVAYKLTMTAWQPLPWNIPNEAELSSVESLMYSPEDEHNKTIIEHFDFACQYKWFFSTAAIVIDYLERHPQQRAQMRFVVLEEDHMSVSNAECHLNGFHQISKESPKLRIERRVGFWSSVYHHNCPHLRYLPAQPVMLDDIDGDEYPELAQPQIGELLPALAEWFREAIVLREHLPDSAFSLVLEGYPMDF